MKVKVNEKCIGCGSCISLTDSTIFDYNEEGHAECIKEEIDEKEVDLVEQAISYCPTGAIEKVNN